MQAQGKVEAESVRSEERATQPGSTPAARQESGSILVVSNRLPVTCQEGPDGLEKKASSGGLVSAMDPILREQGGTWVGWPGSECAVSVDQLSEDSPYRLVPVPLSQAEIDEFYLGFCNSTLWPLCHSIVDRVTYDHEQWEVYEEVNRRFADATLVARGGERLIWIHDYQLMRMPLHLRRAAPAARLAFFLHFPFPSYHIFRLLPWDRDLLRGLLACDLIGFHVPAYVTNFLDCVERLLGCRVDRQAGLIEYGSRTVRAAAFPLGIDFELFAARAKVAPSDPDLGKHRIVLGVDRLDYTKGIPDRIRAFERLLERHPEHQERVVLLQVAVPSRAEVPEYQALKREIDEEVGRVNGRFATATWSPIQYLYRSVTPEVLTGLYRDAEVALITPIRDGMNLVCKEFVACQVRDPGVLVLSRMAGAAETMPEAMLINPYDLEGTADAVHRALNMEVNERRTRMTALRQRERRHDVHAWVEQFLTEAQQEPLPLPPPSDEDFAAWLGPEVTGRKIVLALDLDGTLTAPAAPDAPSGAPIAAPMRRALERCIAHPGIEVLFLAERPLADLRARLGLEGGLCLGNHGLEIEGHGMQPFLPGDLERFRAQCAGVVQALRGLAAPGIKVHDRGLTASVDLSGVPAALRETLADDAAERIRAGGFYAPVRSEVDVVDALPSVRWNKGRALLHVLNHLYGLGWSEEVLVIYAGDSGSDEAAFQILEGLGHTFRIGSDARPTAAHRTLPDPECLHRLIEWVLQAKSL